VAVLKMASNCYPCILDRAKFESDLVLSSEAEKKAAVEELVDFMACHKGGVPALVGTERERIIKRRSGKSDPYQLLKEESNRVAKSLLPVAERFYEEADDKIELDPNSCRSQLNGVRRQRPRLRKLHIWGASS